MSHSTFVISYEKMNPWGFLTGNERNFIQNVLIHSKQFLHKDMKKEEQHRMMKHTLRGGDHTTSSTKLPLTITTVYIRANKSSHYHHNAHKHRCYPFYSNIGHVSVGTRWSEN